MEVIIAISGTLLLLTGLSYSFLIFSFFSGWNRLKRNTYGLAPVKPLKVSVIVAVRDEERNILTLIGDLMRQDFPADCTEVILADDFSSDSTFQRAEEFISQNNLENFKIIKREGHGPAGSKKAALTLAVKEARGEILLTTDADCRLPEGWISALVRPFEDTQSMLVAGPVSFQPPGTLFDRFQCMEFLGLVASGAGAAGAGMPFLCNGANMGYRREAFFGVKGYEGNEKFRSGDDVFLLHKIKKAYGNASISFMLDRHALVLTPPAGNLVSFIGQRARWASKSRGYKDSLAVLTALTVFLVSLFLTGLFISGFFYPMAFLLFAGLILCKAAVDYPLMREILEFTGNRSLLKWIVPFEAIYPFYVVMSGIISLVRRNYW